MKLIKVAAGVLNQTPLDWSGNYENMVAAIATARAEQVTILCLPELCITGYGCEDAFHAPNTHHTAWDMLEQLAPQSEGMIVTAGLPIMLSGSLYNAAALLVNGEIAGLVAKQNLASEGIHYEPRWFRAWPNDRHTEYKAGGKTYPLGDLMFDCGGVTLGFEICEDAWVANRPGAELARRGADIILNPSASHFAFGKQQIRERFVLDGSRAFCAHYIYSNLLGNEAGRAIYDGGAIIASAGKMQAVGPRFSFENMRVTSAVIDIDATRMIRARTGSFSPQITQDRSDCINLEFTYPNAEVEANTVAPPAWEQSEFHKEEEFTRAVSLGLFDYLRKSRSRGFVVSLSGGADSAAVTVLCYLAVRLASGELGLEKVREKLSYLPSIAAAEDTGAMVRELVLCAYQATRNSGDVTLHAASQVATATGAEFMQLNVDPIVEQYKAIISQAIERPLDWQRDDIALQNIQARVRSPSIWMLANIRNALLLSTSNRSEAAVGYATMDGDTSGGLSPIAGIDKAFLRIWLKWMETAGPESIGPMAGLHAVNVQQPTAELRPPSAGQTDEADLMPYPLLDAVERLAILDKLAPVEAYRQLRITFPAIEHKQLAAWIERFYTLWCRNQWKRERYAPSFHLDDENLDPKTWCRFPILSGGYRRELAALRELVAREV